MLTATTSNLSLPSLPCSASSAGISLRHGTHQVAHRFNSTVLPWNAPSVRGLPSASAKASSGSRFGSDAMPSAATSPRASGLSRAASSAAGRHAASAGLRCIAPIPYTAASPTATPATPPSSTMASRRRARLLVWSVISGLSAVMSNKMWGGRFASGPGAIMQEINASIDFDRRLYRQDIAASKAHAAMLARQGIIARDDAAEIAHGLDTILSEMESGKFRFKRALEDIHMNVESRLAELIGPAAGRLHTARSRNDQIATDFKLWVRDAIDDIDAALAGYQRALAEKALAHAATVMPGFTHLQTAQPVTFGHHLLAYVEMAGRDRGRFADARKRLNENPLGAAALAGTSFRLDRAMTSKSLAFDRPAANSLDAVSDRDFVAEALAAASITAMHLSRFAEEIVLWCSPLVGFVRLSDKFTTGSSIMPQKRNPDAAELVRAKTGRIFGALQGILVVMKGLPLTYQKDMQEDKEGAMDALSALMLCVAAMSGMVADMVPDADTDEGCGRRELFDRDRSRRLAGAHVEAAVPRGAPHHRAHRGGGRAGRRVARGAAACRHAGDRAAHHQGGVRRAVGRALGRKPRQPGRHGARQCPARGEEVAETARQKVMPGCLSLAALDLLYV